MPLPKLITARCFSQIELAKEGIPLPFGNRFWASNWPTGKAPLPGLIINLTTSVSALLNLYWEHAHGIAFVGHRDSWASHGCGVSVHIGCPRISCSDYQLLRCHRMWSSFTFLFLFMYEVSCAGSLLDASEAARYPQTIQG